MKKILSLSLLLALSSSAFASEAPSSPEPSNTLLSSLEYGSVMAFTGFASNQFGFSSKQTGLLAVSATTLLYLVKLGEGSTNEKLKTFSSYARRTINALPVLATVYKAASLPSVTNAFTTRGTTGSLAAVATKGAVVGVSVFAGNHLLNNAFASQKASK